MKKIFRKGFIWTLVLSFFIEALPTNALVKEETIYAKAKSDGKITSTNVYEHLKGTTNGSLNDLSSLKNISNINGEEKFKKEDNRITWEAKGDDIYYSGTTDKDLPISMDVKYYLDGKEYKAKEMLGKKGHVKIVINYKNNLKKQVLVNGRMETLYVPFVVATTSLLSNETNKNIRITNGKVIDNGNSSLIVGISAPGLYESLDLEEVKEFDTLEVSYDTTSFELYSTYAVATSKLIGEDDLNIFNSIKNLYNGISTLQDNMDLIVDGANQLAAGTNTLNESIQEITKKYYEYRNMNNEELVDTVSPVLKDVLTKIAPRLEEKVVDEAVAVINEHKSEMATSIAEATVINTRDVIEKEINELLENLSIPSVLQEIIGSHLTEALLKEENIEAITNAFSEALEEELQKEISNTTSTALTALVNNIYINKTEDQKRTYAEYIASKYGITYEQARAIVDEAQEDAVSNIKNSMAASLPSIVGNISITVINNMTNQEYIKNIINEYVANVNNRVNEVISNNPELDDVEQELLNNIRNYLRENLTREEILNKYNNATNYVNDVVDEIIQNTASDVADQYTVDMSSEIITNLINEELYNTDITDELHNVLSDLQDDINTKLNIVDDNIDKLSNGVAMLNNGAFELANGLDRFNNEGIKKISGLINGDVRGLTAKVEALVRLSNEYKTLDDIKNDVNGSSKIIIMIDAMKKEETKKTTNEKIVEKESLWDKIKGLFK